VQLMQLLGEARLRSSGIVDVSSYRPPLTLIPPFSGCWFIIKGGVSREDSHSWDIVAQRFAYDMIVASDLGKLASPCRYRSLNDWDTYGSPVVAAASGIVTKTVDGVPDNEPVGRVNLAVRSLEGNHVVIKHSEGLYTLYAHLRKGSIAVEPGQKVEAGQTIGEAGNSGMSTLPHLHFQLMTTSSLYATISLPPYMKFKSADGKLVKGYPKRGDIICSIPPQTQKDNTGEGREWGGF